MRTETGGPPRPSPRLAILADHIEEQWPSMDLCAAMLWDQLSRGAAGGLRVGRLAPPYRRLATRVPGFGRSRPAFNADRLLNRFVHYPRAARTSAREFDLFHIVDHSYAQLALALPAGRVGVFCHDLDAFRCLHDPASEPRPGWFRAMARRIRDGLQRAAVVFHSTHAVGEQIRRCGLVAPERLVLAPYGIAPEFGPEPPESATPVCLPWAAAIAGRPWLLHVGSCIPRKRTDVLLEVVAAVRHAVPEACLVKVGGDWSPADRTRLARLGLSPAIVHVAGLERAELAEVYRRAALVLVPSAAEGFGLPVIEALACGTRVVASDIPALREAGGTATTFAPVGAVDRWAEVVRTILASPDSAAARADRLAWAGQFSWATHAQIIAAAYQQLL